MSMNFIDGKFFLWDSNKNKSFWSKFYNVNMFHLENFAESGIMRMKTCVCMVFIAKGCNFCLMK